MCVCVCVCDPINNVCVGGGRGGGRERENEGERERELAQLVWVTAKYETQAISLVVDNVCFIFRVNPRRKPILCAIHHRYTK